MSAPRVFDYLGSGSRSTFFVHGQEHGRKCQELLGAARLVAEAIRAVPGFAPGRRVALLLPAGFEWASALLGAWKARAVPVCLNPGAMSDELEHCLEASDAFLIVTDGHRDVAFVDAEIPCLDARLSVDATRDAVHLAYEPRALEDEALILFTSGSTGLPKGVRIVFRGLEHTVSGLSERLEVRDEVFLLPTSTHHIFSIVTFLLALRTGSDAVLLPTFSPELAIEAIERRRATIGFGPLELFLSMATCPTLTPEKVESFHTVLLGGSPARESQVFEIERALGLARVFLSFGMTETTGGVSVELLRDNDGRPVIHAGRPMNTIEIAAFDGDRRLPDGQAGEVRLRGPHLMAGYLGQEPIGKDEWLRSGDLGFIDASGLLHITGRIKDVIIRAGENISTTEIERVLLGCQGVQQACVVGIPDERLGESIAAAVVRSDANLDKRGLQQHCLRYLARTKIPRYVVFFEALPSLPTGKIDKNAVREMTLLAQKGKKSS